MTQFIGHRYKGIASKGMLFHEHFFFHCLKGCQRVLCPQTVDHGIIVGCEINLVIRTSFELYVCVLNRLDREEERIETIKVHRT